ncbi:hypothetical protein B0J18DRAFT_414601 [Chaetomium sp. MPI-SDFR-AT-0129]|nr:hypothetical protein B0J18DRAFT_414601 [Chaetomium sp. MPI-SDFR-AT-0129]
MRMEKLALDLRTNDHRLSAISTDLLLAELSRRDDATTERPVCGSGETGSYDTAIHVFALFLILTVSTLGMSLSTGHRALPRVIAC